MRPAVFEYERFFPVPVERAYAWLTDFRDDDVERAKAGLVHARRVVERSKTRVVYDGAIRAMGRIVPSRTEVDLAPPDRWESRVIEGPRTGSSNSYRLLPSPGGCTLRITYRVVSRDPLTRIALRVARPLVRREFERMWDGFSASMRQEMGAARGSPSPSTDP